MTVSFRAMALKAALSARSWNSQPTRGMPAGVTASGLKFGTYPQPQH